MLYFDGYSPELGHELWKSDGTVGGTALVQDINPSNSDSFPTPLTAFHGKLVFTAIDGVHGRELWLSDGSNAGTHLIADVEITPAIDSSPASLTNNNGNLLFSANDGVHGRELWTSDGTASGTNLLKDAFSGASDFVEQSDSKSTGFPGTGTPLVWMNGYYYFGANDGFHGRSLWRTDGTAPGTTLVADYNTGSEYFDGDAFSEPPEFPTNVNGTLYFTGHDYINGGELRKSDGTSAGTSLVADITRGKVSSTFSSLISYNNLLYFLAQGGLWKSNGTSAGTIKVVSTSFDARLTLSIHGGYLYYFDTLSSATVLKKSDGTAAGTVTVASFPSTISSPKIYSLNGKLYFVLSDGVHGKQLWQSDGTAAGTIALTNLSSGVSQILDVVGEHVLFVGNDGIHGSQIWKSDGTPVGASAVTNSSFQFISSGFNANGILLFSALETGVSNSSLYRSDGTMSGTYLVSDVGFGSNRANVGSKTFFAGRQTATGNELWVYTPGTVAAVRDSSGNLTLTDIAGNDDSFSISRTGSILSISNSGGTFDSVPLGGSLSVDERTLSFDTSITVINSITINGAAGKDSFAVDLSGSNRIPSGGINVNGGDPMGSPGDSLTLVGGNIGPVTQTSTSPSDGTVSLLTSGLIRYTGLETYPSSTAPYIIAITPVFGPTVGGSLVTITGVNFTGASSVTFGGSLASFTINSETQITAVAPPGLGAVDVQITSPTGVSAVSSATHYTFQNAPQLISTIVNAATPELRNLPAPYANQRSMVRSIQLTFDNPVTLAPGAIDLGIHPNPLVPNAVLPGTIVVQNSSGGQGLDKTWNLTFAGVNVVGGSIGDGEYDVNFDISRIADQFGQKLSSASKFTFYRLFGDSDGSRAVNNVAVIQARRNVSTTSASPNYLWLFDADWNGTINNVDIVAIRRNVNKTI